MASSIPAQGREPTISKTLSANNKSVTACKTTSDHLVVAKEGALYTFNFADHSLNTLQERGNTIWSLASRDDDDSLLVTGGTEGELRLWDVKTKAVTRTLKGHTETIRSLQIVNGTTLISGSRDSTIRFWDLDSDSNDPTLTLRGHAATVKCLRVHGSVLVSGSYDSDARIWDICTGECLHVLKGHTGPLYDVCFEGSQVITASLDTDIRVWDPQSGACRAVFSGHKGLVGQLALQGNTLVSGDNLGTVKLWSLDAPGSGQTIAQKEKENPMISLALDGGNILFGNANGSVHLVRRDLGAREALLTGVDNVWCVGFTPSKRPWVVYVKGEDTQLGIF